MNCPLKKQTFTTDTTCDKSECAWWIGECAITTLAKGSKSGIRINYADDTEIDTANGEYIRVAGTGGCRCTG